MEERYILHDGFLTDCLIPHPWWILKGPQFDVIPGDHAIARHSWFFLRGVPLFYSPYFYKSLKKEPRRSGFLIPNAGNSSAHGKMVGFGYFWAISRSFDLTYRGQYFSESGLAHHAELRGKINQNTDFDLSVFGIKDTQNTDPPDSGVRIRLLAKSELGDGWEARGSLDYLSSFAFVQDFTQSFTEAVSSQTDSVGFVDKHWSDFGVAISSPPAMSISRAPLPATPSHPQAARSRFRPARTRDRCRRLALLGVVRIDERRLSGPQPGAFQTRQFVDRVDFAPHVTTAFHWGDFQLIPTFGIRETQYGESSTASDSTRQRQTPGSVIGQNLLRSSRDLTVDLVLPGLERIFKAPKWMGDKVKHVIEPRITYKYVNGIDNFNQIIRFDETDMLTDTNQMEFSLTNRLMAKDKNGIVTDLLSAGSSATTAISTRPSAARCRIRSQASPRSDM